jgi:hypothetical protein
MGSHEQETRYMSSRDVMSTSKTELRKNELSPTKKVLKIKLDNVKKLL